MKKKFRKKPLLLNKIIILIILILFIFSFMIINQNKATNIIRIQPTKNLSLTERKNKAVERGIQWIIEHNDDVSPKDAVWLLSDLYKVIPNDEYAERIKTIIQEKLKIISDNYKNKSIIKNKYDDEINLATDAFLLLLVKCSGEETNLDSVKLKDVIKELEPIEDPLLMYSLNKLGLKNKDDLDQIISENLMKLKRDYNPPDNNLLNGQLSVLTHLILYKSDYFSYYLDPKNYSSEIKTLKDSVFSLSPSSKIIQNNIDLLSQSLFSLKILKQKPDEKINEIYKLMIEIQNPDGSWSQMNYNKEFTFHNTVMATIALLELPNNLKNEDSYCLHYLQL